MAGAGHHLAALAGRQAPVVLRFEGDADGPLPGLEVLQAQARVHQGRGELLAGGDHFADRIAPAAAVAPAQGHLGHRALAQLGLVAGFQVDRRRQAQRIGGGLRQDLGQPQDEGQLHGATPCSVAPLRLARGLLRVPYRTTGRRGASGLAFWGWTSGARIPGWRRTGRAPPGIPARPCAAGPLTGLSGAARGRTSRAWYGPAPNLA